MGPRKRVRGWRMRKALTEVEAPDLPGREKVTRTVGLISSTSTMVLIPPSTITNNMYRNLVDYPPLVQDEGLKLVIRETNQMIRVQS